MAAAEEPLFGAEALRSLARVYPQLHLTPGAPGAEEAYKSIVTQGESAPAVPAEPFAGSADDRLEYEHTPAGTVPVLTLGRREDFERFLQIMAHRCVPVPIPPTQGAAILDGVINWTKIRAHKEAFFRGGGTDEGWAEEFPRFTAVKENFKDALIVLSTGPYSALRAEEAGFPEEEWLAVSHRIRKAHECTHFLCRRLFPDKKDAVWDEIVADAVGITAALGRYDAALAARFLGVGENGYSGGRLENYVDGEQDREERLEALSGRVWEVIRRFEAVTAGRPWPDPYALAIRLEEEMPCWRRV